ncbi:hypothetical protein MC885_008002, partial [Smutsia gigantea]
SLVKDASPVPLIDVTNLPTPRKFLDPSQSSTPVREINLQDIKEDLELDPEENSTLFMGILIKGLAKLKKIPETVKAIQERLEQELKQIVKRSTTQVADSGYQRGENLTVDSQPRKYLTTVVANLINIRITCFADLPEPPATHNFQRKIGSVFSFKFQPVQLTTTIRKPCM